MKTYQKETPPKGFQPIHQRKSKEAPPQHCACEGEGATQLKALQRMINNSAHQKELTQLQANTNSSTLQRKPTEEEQPKKNNTGLPDQMKANLEALSGFSMDDVRVHYNSDKPAQLQAHAYAQGTDIHLAPGQEKHLGHEAWHVVQQKQGRVKPTMQLKGVSVNDDVGLEREADLMAHNQRTKNDIMHRETVQLALKKKKKHKEKNTFWKSDDTCSEKGGKDAQEFGSTKNA